MKKAFKIIAILTFLTLLSIQGLTFAANGPMPDDGIWDVAYLVFYSVDGSVPPKAVYTESNVVNEMPGASYNKDTNTLTINNLDTNLALEANAMGDDFTINVVGNNKISKISIWGWGYGGSLKITGTGTLTVNENKSLENAITLYAETSNSVLDIGESVNVNLYATKNAIAIYETTSNNAIILRNNSQNINANKEQYHNVRPVTIKGYYLSDSNNIDYLGIQHTRASDPTGIYCIQFWTRYDDNDNPIKQWYGVKKYIYNSDLGYYFVDKSFGNEQNDYEIEMTIDEYNNSEYTPVKNGEEDVWLSNPKSLNYSTYLEVYEDNNHKQYVVIDTYSNNEDRYKVYDFTKIYETADEYMLTLNNNVSASDLNALTIDEYEEGAYNYLVSAKSLIISAKPIHIHSYKTVITHKASINQDGKIIERCDCGNIKSEVTINRPVEFKLSKTILTYNKKVQKPTITIKDSTGKIIDSSNYIVSYSNNNSKNIGEYKIIVAFTGDFYEGNQTLKYYIAQKETSISKLSAAKKKFTVTWKKQTYETTGYEIQYSTSKDFTSGNKKVSITNNKTTSKSVTKLKAKKKYYVRIRTYKKVGKNKIYSDWSKSKSVTTKK